MLLTQQIVLPLCFTLAALSSTAYGVIVERDVSPKLMEESKEEFQVQTTTRDGNTQFTVTRFLREGRHCSGELVIRKGGPAVVVCRVQPSQEKSPPKNKSALRYVFTVSPDYIADSDFLLWEGRYFEFSTIEPGNGNKVTTQELENDTRFRFRLRDFAKSAGGAH
jgi:hypothetical protein